MLALLPVSIAAAEFTIAVLPDTQLYSLRHPETYSVQTRWIRDRMAKDNIKFAIHLGDIVHNNTQKEWEAADRAHAILDKAGVAYSMVPGNHDMANVNRRLTRDTSMYNKFFPPSRYKDRPWYGGHLGKTNDNNFCRFEAAGMKFLVVSLEFLPTDETLTWAAGVIRAHPEHRVIVATHCYMTPTGRENKSTRSYRLTGNTGEQMWQKLTSKHANIFMVVSGHILGVGLQISKRPAGGSVIEMLTDYQGLPRGGNGWLRTMRFSPRENKIHIRAYSPLLDRENLDPRHTQSLPYDMTLASKKKAG